MNIQTPLRVEAGTSRYKSGTTWFLQDAFGNKIAETGAEARADVFRELARMVNENIPSVDDFTRDLALRIQALESAVYGRDQMPAGIIPAAPEGEQA